MSGELELSKVQGSGEIVARRNDVEEDSDYTSFYMLTSGFASGITAALVSQEVVAFGFVIIGTLMMTQVVDSWRKLRIAEKFKDIDYYCVIQLESLTQEKAPTSLYKEIKAMRANLTEGEKLVLDPFVMMAVPRPEEQKTWVSLSKAGLSMYLKEPEVDAAQWDEQFALGEKGKAASLPGTEKHPESEES